MMIRTRSASNAVVSDHYSRFAIYTLVTVRQELEESRAATTAARVAEEAGRQQLARMMDEQLVQNQAIESLRRQLETSNNATQDAQALLRMNQEQQKQHVRMPPPTTLRTLTGGYR